LVRARQRQQQQQLQWQSRAMLQRPLMVAATDGQKARCEQQHWPAALHATSTR
jgi:hypothetical protein